MPHLETGSRQNIGRILASRGKTSAEETNMRFAGVTLLVCLLLLGASTDAQEVMRLGGQRCGMAGDARTSAGKTLNRLKNRYTAPTGDDIDDSISLAKLLQPGDDLDRFDSQAGARIAGYVVDVKAGGKETCNCHATDPEDRDTHIEVALTPDAGEIDRVIVEVTPRLRTQMREHGLDWTTDALRQQLKGKWVQFTGWMMFDTMHINQAENTNPGGDKNWRATCWEIHPVTAINVTAAPQLATKTAAASLSLVRAKRMEELKSDPAARDQLRKRNEGLLLQFSDEDKAELGKP
jgi:hypothetical protein